MICVERKSMRILPGICTLHGNSLAVISFDGLPVSKESVGFNVSTYKSLKLNRIDDSINNCWDDQFGYANSFIETLTTAEKIDLANFYISASDVLVTSKDYGKMTAVLGELFQDISHKLQLPHKLNAYVVSANIYVPDLSNVGTRAHDTDEMTFRHPEYVQLIAICILCKLFCPIWGEFIYTTAKNIDNASKELYCMSTIDPILCGPVYGPLRAKFRNFISRIMDSDSGKRRASLQDSKFVAAVGGYSQDRLDDGMYAIILVRKFSNVKLNDCDLMRYAHVSVVSNNTARNVALRQHNVFIRADPPREGDSQAPSIMEHECITSATTADTPYIARYGVQQIIKRDIETHKISQHVFSAAAEHYRLYPIVPSIYSNIVISTLYGSSLGGGASIDSLDAECYTGLVILAQITLLNNYPSHLIHLLSASTRLDRNSESDVSIENISIMSNFRNSGMYKRIEAAYPYSIDQKSIQVVLQELCDWTCAKVHQYNTPAVISDLLDEEQIHPGHVQVVYPRSVMIDMCALIADICKIS
jgi:hypothetical protein